MELLLNHQLGPFGLDSYSHYEGGANMFGIDWNDPVNLMVAMGGRMPECPSPAEVKEEAKERSSKIFSTYRTLNKILERHEATIQKRWSKKTRSQRLRILLNAWPDMPASHRPDFEAFRNEPSKKRKSGTKHRGAYIWPYINQEDLSQTRPLPLLLNARGRTPPTTFVGADHNAMQLGKTSLAIVAIALDEYTVVLNRATSEKDYGEMLDWDTHPDACDWIHSRTEFLPGEALLILEAQERVLVFLVECCQELLHEIPADTLTSDEFPVQPEPRVKSESDASGFESLAVLAAEAPYRVPGQLDLGRMESLLEARVSAAEDRLWILREDPSYFTQRLLETKEHQQELMRDTLGQSHHTACTGRTATLWSRILGNALTDAYLPLELFSELHKQVQMLQRLRQKHAEISLLDYLPEEYLVALVKFRHYLIQGSRGMLSNLEARVMASPPMRKFYVREPSDGKSKIAIRPRTGVKMTKVEEHLIWLLHSLWDYENRMFSESHSLMLDELERLIQAEPQAQALISSPVAKLISDASIIFECLRQLDLYRPWALQFDQALQDRGPEIDRGFMQLSEPWREMFLALDEHNLNVFAKLSDPSSGNFTYPFSKRRTRENVDALRLAEANLDDVWASFDRIFEKKDIQLDRTAAQHLLSQPRMLQRTPEWVGTATAAKDKQAADPDVEALVQPFSAVFCNRLSTLDDTTQRKTKAETKGTPSKPEDDSTETPEIAQIDHRPTVPIDARSLKVFRTLFFNPAVSSSPGDVPWNEFLHAMALTGFRAEKLYGFVWQFSPTKLNVKRSIQFNEPHPKGKMTLEVARRFGRRLTRAYGWSAGTFVLRQK
ncbi:hypothetical protein BGZ61DRAFT_442937 [Ilyonectria robusta]|uniref:uncharacterized protein n=1 Tax=Ilyonectria robusta TaxID=1079257 RepID=UPI001E8D8443|nr:uncharacterized protein BGZ61DRAFT_442937 [Ilyonectria robusta]KAH8734678.1 hypothetical protein BGZ61DRAFT_442937 [Ilyonectria robusta]